MLKMKCSCCGVVELKNVIEDGITEYVCAECLERDFTPCENCGVWTYTDNIRTVRSIRYGREVHVCAHCCDRLYI